MKKKRTVWARIEEVLIERKLPSTQTYGAGLVGLSQPAAALWNKPGKYPDMRIAVELADRLGVCVQWLLTEEGPKRAAPKNDQQLDALFAAWAKLSEADKRSIVGFAHVRADAPTEKDEPAVPVVRRTAS